LKLYKLAVEFEQRDGKNSKALYKLAEALLLWFALLP